MVKKTNHKEVFKQNSQEKQEYQQYIEELCDSNYKGGSWFLPENPTPLQVIKHEICKLLVSYKQDKNLTTEEIAKKIALSETETEDVLYYRIDYFTLDQLVAHITRLFGKLETKIFWESKKTDYARTV